MGDKKNWENQSKDWNNVFLLEIKNRENYDSNIILKSLIRLCKKKDKILDQGCGVGQYALTVYKLGFQNVTGMDFSKKLLSMAEKNSQKLGYKVKFIEGDIRNMPFNKNSFDAVISGGIVEHVPETEKTIEELSRIINKGGYLFIHVPNRISLFTLAKVIQQIMGIWKCGYEKSFTKRYFSNLLTKNGFQILEYKLHPFVPGKHKIIGGVMSLIDKPMYRFGFGGHHISFICKKIK